MAVLGGSSVRDLLIRLREMDSYESASMSWSIRINVVGTCIGGFLVLLILWKIFGSGKRVRLPPGPPGWPVLGHLPNLGALPHQSLMKLSQKYGPLMSIRLGLVRAVVASSPEMAKILLRTQDHLFATRPRTLNGEVFMYNYQDMAFSPYNDNFRTLKKLLDSEIFSHKRLQHRKNYRDEEILAAVQRMLGTGREGNLVEIKSNVLRLSCDHVSRVCFNECYSCCKVGSPRLEGEPRDLLSLLHEWAVIAGSFIVGEYIPCLRKLDLGGQEAAFLELRMAFEKFLEPIIEEHRRKPEEEDKDFLDVLLSLQREKAGSGFPDEQIKALLKDMLIGGTATTANTITWALTELVRHPEIAQKVVEELDLVVGKDRLVEESDLVNLKYLKATVKETFRMYPAGPLGMPREAIEDTQVAGYDIPKYTRVLVNVYALGRDPTLWTNPNVFNPERFVDNQMDVKGQHFELLPFGAGRRGCPATDMGLILVHMAVVQILHTCVLSLPPSMEVDVEEGLGQLTLSRAHPLKVLVSPRLRPEVYSRHGMKF